MRFQLEIDQIDLEHARCLLANAREVQKDHLHAKHYIQTIYFIVIRYVDDQKEVFGHPMFE